MEYHLQLCTRINTIDLLSQIVPPNRLEPCQWDATVPKEKLGLLLHDGIVMHLILFQGWMPYHSFQNRVFNKPTLLKLAGHAPLLALHVFQTLLLGNMPLLDSPASIG